MHRHKVDSKLGIKSSDIYFKKTLLTHRSSACSVHDQSTYLDSHPQCRDYPEPRSAVCQMELVVANGTLWLEI